MNFALTLAERLFWRYETQIGAFVLAFGKRMLDAYIAKAKAGALTGTSALLIPALEEADSLLAEAAGKDVNTDAAGTGVASTETAATGVTAGV